MRSCMYLYLEIKCRLREIRDSHLYKLHGTTEGVLHLEIVECFAYSSHYCLVAHGRRPDLTHCGFSFTLSSSPMLLILLLSCLSAHLYELIFPCMHLLIIYQVQVDLLLSNALIFHIV